MFSGPNFVLNMESAVKVIMKNEAATLAGIAAAAILEKVVSVSVCWQQLHADIEKTLVHSYGTSIGPPRNWDGLNKGSTI
jgi:hypothetical protein